MNQGFGQSIGAGAGMLSRTQLGRLWYHSLLCPWSRTNQTYTAVDERDGG
jgi:hypothetical protein